MFVVFQDAHFLHSICTDLCSLTRWHHRESLFVHVSLRRCCCIFCVCDRCCVERRSIHFSLHLHTIVFNRHSNISQLSLSPIFICFNLHSLRALSLYLSPSAYAGSVSFSVGQAIYFPTLMCEPHLKFSKLYTDQKQSEDLLHYGQIMFRSTLGVK